MSAAEHNKATEPAWTLELCLMLADIAPANGREAEATRYVGLAYDTIDGGRARPAEGRFRRPRPIA